MPTIIMNDLKKSKEYIEISELMYYLDKHGVQENYSRSWIEQAIKSARGFENGPPEEIESGGFVFKRK